MMRYNFWGILLPILEIEPHLRQILICLLYTESDGIQLENTKLILLMRSIYSFYTPFLCFEIQDLKYKI
jgi:hypothetical protein